MFCPQKNPNLIFVLHTYLLLWFLPQEVLHNLNYVFRVFFLEITWDNYQLTGNIDHTKCMKQLPKHAGKTVLYAHRRSNCLTASCYFPCFLETYLPLKASACCSTDSLTIFQKQSDTARLKFFVVTWCAFSILVLKRKTARGGSLHSHVSRPPFSPL